MRIPKKSQIVLTYVAVAIVFVIFVYVLVQNARYKPHNEAISIREDDRYRIFDENNTTAMIQYVDLSCNYCNDVYHFEEKNEFSIRKKMNVIYRVIALRNNGEAAYRTLVGECIYKLSGEKQWFAYIDYVFDNFADTRYADDATFFDLGEGYVASSNELRACVSDNAMQEKVKRERERVYIDGIFQVPSFALVVDRVERGKGSLDRWVYSNLIRTLPSKE
jgi:hypothetical protein